MQSIQNPASPPADTSRGPHFSSPLPPAAPWCGPYRHHHIGHPAPSSPSSGPHPAARGILLDLRYVTFLTVQNPVVAPFSPTVGARILPTASVSSSICPVILLTLSLSPSGFLSPGPPCIGQTVFMPIMPCDCYNTLRIAREESWP